MTTNTKINEVLEKVNGFQGVYLYDQLHLVPNKSDGVVVVNYVTRSEAKKGIVGHYSVIDYRDGVIKGSDNWLGNYYFGSYGVPPDLAREYLGLPNTGNVQKFMDEVAGQWRHNTIDFQSKKPYDDTCGVYACLYVLDSNFEENPVFQPGIPRLELDDEMMGLFRDIGFLDNLRDPLTGEQERNALTALRNLSDGFTNFDSIQHVE